MIKPNDKLAPIFRSLHPDESAMAKSTNVVAQEAAEKWPLFKVLAPKKPLSTPALSDSEKQNWLSPSVEPLMPSTPAALTSNLGDKLAVGLSRMASRKKLPPRQPTKEAKTAEQAPIARNHPSLKSPSVLLSQKISEKHNAPVVAPALASELVDVHKANTSTSEKTITATSAFKPSPLAVNSDVLTPGSSQTSSVMHDKSIRPKRIRKQAGPTRVQSETVQHEPPVQSMEIVDKTLASTTVQSDPVFDAPLVQSIEIVDKTPEPLTPIDPPKTSASLKSLLNKLQNPGNTTTETNAAKTPAFLSRLYKK
jgi:hypothetical protein